MFIRRGRRSGTLALIALAALGLLTTLTNPVDNVIYTAFFFGLLLVFLLCLGHFLVRLQTGQVSAKNRYRIVAISLVLLVLLMFRSAKSLSWVDGIILALIGFGLFFYISKR